MSTATRSRPTAAQRARTRARRDRPLVTPPPPLRRTQGAVRDLTLSVAGRSYPIGRNVDGATPWEMTVEGAATVTIPVRSPDGTLLRRLGDESMLQRDGARVVIDGTVYVVSGVADDGNGLVTLTVQDEVAWRLGLFDKPMSANRATTTRAGFIRRLIDEAARPPRAGIRAFIPEVRDIQQIAKPAAVDRDTSEVRTGDTDAPTAGGFGTGTQITVKGQTATAVQRSTIDACLTEAARLGASRRVMVAVVMCITQESNAGDPRYTNRGDAAGPDSRGPYQQRAPWGPLETRMDPAGSTRLFLTSNRGHGLNGWQAVHGSLKNAPGNLSHAINKVQISAYPDAYGQWQAEAERTVAAWSGGDATTSGDGASATRTRRYEFTRGEKGGARETSWEASGRLAEEVGWLRWAAGNTFYFVSAEELRRASPSARIAGDEAWLASMPSFEWATRRPTAECQLAVFTDRFMVMPGASVVLTLGGPLDGRWLVHSVAGERLDSPLATVTLRRPTLKRLEPAPETETASRTADSDTAGGTSSGEVVGGFAKPLPPGYPAPGPHGSARNAFGGDAVDIMVPYGTPVYAIQAGTIGSQIGALASSSPYLQGLRLHLLTPDGNDWYYAHLSRIVVSAGQRVVAGQLLGYSGRANGADHLHLEDKKQTVRQRI